MNRSAAKTQAAVAVCRRKRCQRSAKSLSARGLFDSPPNRCGATADRYCGVDVFQLVVRQAGDGSFQFVTVPVRERAALDASDEAFVRLVDRPYRETCNHHAPINIRTFQASMNCCGIRYAVPSSNGSNRTQINGRSSGMSLAKSFAKWENWDFWGYVIQRSTGAVNSTHCNGRAGRGARSLYLRRLCNNGAGSHRHGEPASLSRRLCRATGSLHAGHHLWAADRSGRDDGTKCRLDLKIV
jgi:hypothetical protein